MELKNRDLEGDQDTAQGEVDGSRQQRRPPVSVCSPAHGDAPGEELGETDCERERRGGLVADRADPAEQQRDHRAQRRLEERQLFAAPSADMFHLERTAVVEPLTHDPRPDVSGPEHRHGRDQDEGSSLRRGVLLAERGDQGCADDRAVDRGRIAVCAVALLPGG